MNWKTFGIFILISASFANSGFVVGPRNLAVAAGQRMIMACRVSNGSDIFKWTMTRPSNTNKEQIFRKFGNKTTVNPNFTHFGFDVDRPGSGSIHINSTQLTDAGLYFCHAKSAKGEEQQFNAHLIVVGEPICETNSTTYGNDSIITVTSDENIRLNCTTTFSGFWSPTVEWTQVHSENKDDKPVKIKEATTEILRNTAIASNVIIHVESGKAIFIIFKIFFQRKNDTVPTNATNIPDYTYRWRGSVGSQNNHAIVWHARYTVYIALGGLIILLAISIVIAIKLIKGGSHITQEEPDVIERQHVTPEHSQIDRNFTGFAAHRPQNKPTFDPYEKGQTSLADQQETYSLANEETEFFPVYENFETSRNENEYEAVEEQFLSIDEVRFIRENHTKEISGTEADSQYAELEPVTDHQQSIPYSVRHQPYRKSSYVKIDHTAIQ